MCHSRWMKMEESKVGANGSPDGGEEKTRNSNGWPYGRSKKGGNRIIAGLLLWRQAIGGFLNGRLGGKWYRIMVFLWLLVGSAVALWTYYSMARESSRRRHESLVNMCEERAKMLQGQFVASMNHVRALTVLVSTFHFEMTPSALYQEVFAAYTARTAFERPLMSGVAYAQRVLESEREAFEKLRGWNIRHMYTKEVQPTQEEYAPTVFSQETVSYLISLDMMSGQHDRENILRARESGKGALTTPFKLLDSSHLGVVFTFAVYSKELPQQATPQQRTEATVGYLGGAFDVESLVENLLHQLAGNLGIIVNVYDTTNKSDPVLMYGLENNVSNGYHICELDFADPDRKHEMHCSFSDGPQIPFSAIRTSLGILVIVLLVGHILFAAINRIKKVEEDFRKMQELKARAEAADVAKSQFLATVSHEIRTPMNGVLGMLQMLMDTNLDATQKDYAQTAQSSGRALITLINEVLDQAKIESGRLELETVAFNIRSVLDSVLSLFSAKAQAKGIELAVFVSERVPEVVIGDPGRFQQIITNLVCNSVKFTEKGHIFICVRLAEESSILTQSLSSCKNFTEDSALHDSDTLSGLEAADGRNNWESFKLLFNSDDIFLESDGKGQRPRLTDDVKLAVSVEDTGIGIPIHAQHRVFTPFMQADSSTSRTHGGTGIGLSISRCLIELMGGEIRFISRPGVGSTFSFTALLKVGQGNGESGDILLGGVKLPAHFRGMKALVLDGKPVRSLVTKYHLQRLGIEVKTVTSSQLALSMLNGMDGFASEACRNDCVKDGIDMVIIEKDAWGPGTGLLFPSEVRVGLFPRGPFLQSKGLLKIFLLATSLTAEETQKAKAAGFADTVIMKPLRASMLAVCLQLALGFCRREHLLESAKPSVPLSSVLSGKRLLVVDDNIVNRRVAAGALKKYGAIVTCTDGGKSAISMLQPPHNFDACFMDVQMPEMDGFEATRQIRAAELVNMERKSNCGEMQVVYDKRWHVPILAMTADVIQATHEECLRCGMDGYVSKPFEEEQLYKALAPFFDKSSIP